MFDLYGKNYKSVLQDIKETPKEIKRYCVRG